MAASVETGMSKAEMKKILTFAKEAPVHCAVGQGENAALGLLVMHKTKNERALEKSLKDDFPAAKNTRFGTAFIDVDENPKLVKFTLNRAVSGIARKLIKTLKGTGYTKVIIVTEDGSVVEDYEEADEEAAAGDVTASPAPATAAAPPPPPPPPDAPPPPAAKAETPDAASLMKMLASLAPGIPKAVGDDMARKAVLMKLATDANVNIKTGNLTYAANFIAQLKRRWRTWRQHRPRPHQQACSNSRTRARSGRACRRRSRQRSPSCATRWPRPMRANLSPARSWRNSRPRSAR